MMEGFKYLFNEVFGKEKDNPFELEPVPTYSKYWLGNYQIIKVTEPNGLISERIYSVNDYGDVYKVGLLLTPELKEALK